MLSLETGIAVGMQKSGMARRHHPRYVLVKMIDMEKDTTDGVTHQR